MATQKLFPADLYGQGTLNSVELTAGGGGTETTVNINSSTQYSYHFGGVDGQTDWNTVINATSSPNVDTIYPSRAAILSGRGGNVYVNSRIMAGFRLDNIPGTITAVSASVVTTATSTPAFDANIYFGGTTGLTGVGGEYSYYIDNDTTAYSTAQTITGDGSYDFILNSSAVTVANTKPINFVIAFIHDFDYTSTAPTVLDQLYNTTISSIALRVTYTS